MNILIFTPFFAPRVGGVETVSQLLAAALNVRHQVSLVTTTPGPAVDPGFQVLRGPSLAAITRLCRRADAILSFGPSLRFIPIPLLLGKPLVINHYTWFAPDREPITTIQRALCRLRRVTNLAPSRMLAEEIDLNARYMPNPFDLDLFLCTRSETRNRDVVFLGRLVREKGVDVLLRALGRLQQRHQRLHLTVIGEGPDEARLRSLAHQLGVAGQVEWAGRLQGEALALALSSHRIMAVPSVWREPFGVVALEGLASGCRLLVSDNGGLIEAAGPSARHFAAGDDAALADALEASIATPATADQTAGADDHLASFRADRVATQYETLFRHLMERRQ